MAESYEKLLEELNQARDYFNRAHDRALVALPKKRAIYEAVSAWGLQHFPDGQVSIAATLSEFSGTCFISVSAVFTNGDSWAQLIPLFELLETYGLFVEEWGCTEDAANFARTFQIIRGSGGDSINFSIRITLALREGNIGGCRRVFVGLETPPPRQRYVLLCENQPQS